MSVLGYRILTIFVALLLLLAPSSWATEALTDTELDEITAGDFTFSIGTDASGSPTVNFGFTTGGTSGNGQVIIQPSVTPQTAITANTVNFNSPLHIDNMIFNMNICMQCTANTLTQGNLGIPVTVKVSP